MNGLSLLHVGREDSTVFFMALRFLCVDYPDLKVTTVYDSVCYGASKGARHKDVYVICFQFIAYRRHRSSLVGAVAPSSAS